jgi:tetratricopeptide (TPR) repeat protein
MLLWLLLLLTPPASDAPPLPEILLRARDHLEASDRTAARRELTRALELYPESPAVYNLLGVVEAGDGHYEPAEQRFREAIRRAPRYTDARLNLGRLYQENAARDPEAVSKALAQYQAVLEYAPKHVEARFQSATLLQIRGEFDRSLEELERLPAADQERPAVIALRLADHAGKGDHEKADQAAEVLLQRAGVTELDLRSVLPALAEHNREDLAIRLLETMRARGWTSADDLRRLGLLHEEAGDLALGREALEAAWRARPEGVTLLLDLARVAHKQGDLRGALGYLAHARSLEPDNPYVHFSFGMVCVDMDLGAEAYDSLKEAVRLDPDNPSINYAFAAVALHRKDPSEAIPYFRKYAELKPEDPRGPFTIGVAAYEAKDYETAREYLVPAAARPETAAAANYLLARIARADNDFEEAARFAEQAIEAQPDYADPYAELGFVYLQLGEPERAEQALERCLELDPDHYLGNMHLAMLYARTRDPRARAQRERFEDLKRRHVEEGREFLRPIEVRP